MQALADWQRAAADSRGFFDHGQHGAAVDVVAGLDADFGDAARPAGAEIQ